MVIYLRRASVADIARLSTNPTDLDTFVFDDADKGVDLIDFDKAWHALHFMLTGEVYVSEHVLGIIADETPMIGTDKNGLGGFSVIEPERMVRFAEALAGLGDDTLAARYDAHAMVDADIYLADAFVGDEREEALEYILQGVPSLRRFAESCAKNGDGALRIIA